MIWRFGSIVLTLAACRTSMRPAGVFDPEAPERWDEVLSLVVTDEGYVDYDRLEQHRDVLEAFVVWVADPEPWGGKKTQDFHADYLNAYNALVMYQVLERGRPASVLDPRRLLPVDGAAFFLETRFKVGPDWLSLSEIEHQRVRQKELDIRDHAALNCASRSCPPMRNEIYRFGDGQLRAQLDDQMSRWVMDDRGIRFEDGKVLFSPIFDWFERDFDFWTAHQDLCTIAARYASGERRRTLEALAVEDCPHGFFEYDWSLNHAPAAL